MTSRLLRPTTVAEMARRREPSGGSEAVAIVAPIVEDVRRRGVVALREQAERLGDLTPGEPLTIPAEVLDRALAAQNAETRERLRRVAARIRTFAEAQRDALADVAIPVPGGRAGHRLLPVKRAGCYAPGGRYPLPSSVLMTAITARVAGVGEVWVATPRPGPLMLAAAALAGADAVLAVGGAQAVAALAWGAGEVPRCDVVVGPGNRFVTAAKRLVSGAVGTDVPAGPSEVLVIADGTADPCAVAAELLAQAEHDPDAVPLLVSLDGDLPDLVEAELRRQLEGLPTAPVARQALANAGVMPVASADEAAAASDAIAPEHVTLMVADADALASRLTSYGTLVMGARASVVFGDYGAGPNHVLPTAGAARWAGGLSVLTFLRMRTWLRLDDGAGTGALAGDTAWLARQEGLEAHARAAEARASSSRRRASS